MGNNLLVGEYRKHKYYIVKLDVFPMVYIEIPKNRKLYGASLEELSEISICNITYANEYPWLINNIDVKDKWYIGWYYDYKNDNIKSLLDNIRAVIRQLE